MLPLVDAVVIGRNEGARLRGCMTSLAGQVRRIVYVDSGSTDGSVDLAGSLGAIVVPLDMDQPFTAARARNMGLRALADHPDPPEFVQLVDGDCTVDPGWINAALAAFAMHPRAVVVCGRRRERFPDASLYNRMIDREWNTPIGPATACGGDALVRLAAVMAARGYRNDLIAGEEPELCLRLIRAGGQVWRIDASMTLHDAALLRFGQWWRRTERAGHAFAEGAALHGDGPEQHWVRETRRAMVWGMWLPIIGLALVLIHPAGLLVYLAYPLQVVRLAARDGLLPAFFNVLGKFAEALGAVRFYLNRIRRKRSGLIEYK